MIVTEKKDAAAEKLKTAIRSLMTRVAMKFNNRTGRYRKFGTAKLGDMTDPQLLFCGRRVVRVARQQMDFLADIGVNENILKRISDAAQEFETALNIQQDKVADRDIAVERRTEQGNKLYQELVVLCDIGKDIWAEKDPVYYENYCIYESNNEQKKARKQRMIEEAKPAKPKPDYLILKLPDDAYKPPMALLGSPQPVGRFHFRFFRLQQRGKRPPHRHPERKMGVGKR